MMERYLPEELEIEDCGKMGKIGGLKFHSALNWKMVCPREIQLKYKTQEVVR